MIVSGLFAAIVTAAGYLAACRPDDTIPLGPVPPNPPGPASLATVFDAGCTRFEVTVSGTSTIGVTTIAQPSCGPVVPVISGTPTYSSATRLVQLPIALKNQGIVVYQAPAWLLAWPDSVQQVTPAPPPALAVTFQGQDATRPDTASLLPKARVWYYDTLLVSSTLLLQRLDPGKTSRARVIKATLASGLTKFRVQFRTRTGQVDYSVPAAPPDSVPLSVETAISQPSNIIAALPAITGPFPRNVVAVLFQSAATPSERQAAISAIQGEVLGGWPISAGGFYIVRIPDDGTSIPLQQALSTLGALPQVRRATPHLQVDLNYQAPKDGTSWQAWKLLASAADGQNWGPEGIGAPLAWGCTTGDASTRIGVVDNGFRSGIADLTANIAPQSQLDRQVSVSHGTQVASIIAAKGNNTVGMTGVVWNAQLELRDYPPKKAYALLRYARTLGLLDVPIINISSGKVWPQTPSTKPDSNEVELLRLAIRDVLDELASVNKHPLFVLSASNNGIDAYWGGFAPVVLDYPDQVIVVAASNAAGNLWAMSNRGPLVSVAAPGEAVYAYGANRTIISGSGTSFAAPFVTGIAGLLYSAQPTLTAGEIKQLIIQGAQRGGRSAGGIPTASAYQSLVALAERPGSGAMCGNRVWPEGSVIKADRGGVTTTLKDVGSQVYWLTPLHGGRDIRFYRGGIDEELLHFDGTSWSVLPNSADTLIGGFSRSTGAQSHGGDSVVYTNWGDTLYGPYHHAPGVVPLRRTSASVPTTLITFGDSWGGYSASVCVFRERPDPDTCLPYVLGPRQDGGQPTVAYSPMGDSVYVSVPAVAQSYSPSEWYACYGAADPRWECRDLTVGRSIAADTVWAISIATRGKRVMIANPGGQIVRMGMAEGAMQFAYSQAEWTSTLTYSTAGGYWLNSTDSFGACSLTYLATPASPPGTPTVHLPLGNQCSAGSIAPIRRSAGSISRTVMRRP